MNNETTWASSSNGGSRRIKLTLKQHLEIEYVEGAYREEPRGASTSEVPEHLIALLERLHKLGVFDTHQRSSLDEDVGAYSQWDEEDDNPNDLGSVREDGSEKHAPMSADDWPIPGTGCAVNICGSPEGLGELAPRDTTPTYALAKAVQLLWMLLLQAGHLNSEPVTLKAVDVPPAA